VQTAMSSYASALASWASKHPSELASLTGTAAITGLCGANAAQATGTAAHSGSSAGTASHSGSGSAASAAATQTKNAAPKQTGAGFALSLAGVVGFFGLAVGL